MGRAKWGLVLVLITGLMAVAGMGCGGGAADDAADPGRVIKLGMLPVKDNLPFWVAAEKGYFADEGLTVELIDFPSALESNSAIAAGAVDGALGDIVNIAQINDGGTPLKIVWLGQGVTAREGRFAILSAPGSGLTEVEQLKGVEIAVGANTIVEYLVDTLLAEAGFTGDEIAKILIPKIPVRLDSLLSGTIQAAILPDPLAALAEIRGAPLILDTTTANVSQTVVYFRRDVLSGKPEAVRGVMRAYARAVADITADPAAFTDILAEKARVPVEVLESTDHGMEIVYSPPTVPTEEMVNPVLEWMYARDLLSTTITYADLVDERVLE